MTDSCKEIFGSSDHSVFTWKIALRTVLWVREFEPSLFEPGVYFTIKCIGKLPGPRNEFQRSLVFETGEFERPKFDCISLKIEFVLANSKNPDEMLYSVEFNRGQYCLQKYQFVCLFVLILYIPNNNLSVMSGRVLLDWTSTKQGLMCIGQGHNAVMLEPVALRSWVKHSTRAA